MSRLENPKTSRLSWDELFMNLALLASQRTACKFHQVGVIFVDNNKRVISIGYNGPTKGDYHCIEVGCAKVDGDPKTGEIKRCRGVHAEMNGIINTQIPRHLQDATLYTTATPCYDCMKALSNAGIKEIVFFEKYVRIKEGGQETEKEDEIWELADKREIIIRQYKGNVYVNNK